MTCCARPFAAPAHRLIAALGTSVALFALAGCEDFGQDYTLYCEKTNQCSTGALSLTPTSLTFSAVPIGTAGSQSVTVTNSGTATTQPIQASITGDTSFVISQSSCDGGLSPDAGCSIQVTFTALSSDLKNGTLTVHSSAQDAVSAQLAGQGVGNGVGLVVSENGNGTGQVVSSDAGINCQPTCSAGFPAGASTVLLATPGPSSVFGGWGGACSGAGSTCLVTLSTPQSVTATFNHRATYNLTVQRTNVANAIGNVTSADGGINCGSTCTTSVPALSTVQLEAIPSGLFGLQSWTNCTSTNGLSCSVTMNADTTVTAQFSPYNYVFVTSAQVTGGTFGGLDGGDALCNAAGLDAGLGGHYVAWLSTSTVNAKDRFPQSARGWIRPDGKPFADTLLGLTQQQAVLYPPRIDEHLGDHPLPGLAATGTHANGMASTNTCVDWTQTSGGLETGMPSGGSVALGSYGGDCATPYSLYCFQVDYQVPLLKLPLPDAGTGRIAFLTDEAFQADGGVTGANQLCIAEATSAGLPAPGTFLALLSTTVAAASTPFNVSGLPYFRVDGVEIADSSTLFAGTNLGAPIDVTASGAYSFNLAWAGSTSPSSAAPDLNSDCNDWSNSGAVSYVGFPYYTNLDFFGGTGESCNSPAEPIGVYCLQQ